MPSTFTYPGIYVEEVPSGVHTVAGVSTSDTAFIDNFLRGPMNRAVRITGLEDFRRTFGELSTLSEASYGVQQYFQNGGQIAWVVRVNTGNAATLALLDLPGGSPQQTAVSLAAANEGTWGNDLQVGVDYVTLDPAKEFNLTVREVRTTGSTRQVVASETFRNLRMAKTSPRFVMDVINRGSALLQVLSVGNGFRPFTTGADVTSPTVVSDVRPTAPFTAVGTTGPAAADSPAPDAAALTGGLPALDRIAPSIFNLMCLPAAANLQPGAMQAVLAAASSYCEDKRAFLIVDLPPDTTVGRQADAAITAATAWVASAPGRAAKSKNSAVYFPRLEIPDALNDNRPRDVGPSGTLAGVFARIDSARGVWKAPAGTEAYLRGAAIPEALKLTDAQNGALNPFGINAVRTFPVFGTVAWGARTMDGADIEASEWKYVPVRRVALYIEESLYQALGWVVFEPNDEPLWSQIRLNVGAFMHDLFRQGAFQGRTPREAYFVKCDRETTTQSDVNRGIVNILVGLAPLKPAEFVLIRIQQIAGEIET